MKELVHVIASDEDLIAESLAISEERARTNHQFTQQMDRIFWELKQRNIVFLEESGCQNTSTSEV